MKSNALSAEERAHVVLVVHQDNGAPMISWEFLSALRFWGQPSYSRPGVCDDNPFSESMFRGPSRGTGSLWQSATRP